MVPLIFILGREPQLSVAEIAAVVAPYAPDWNRAVLSRDVLVLPLAEKTNAPALMHRLGGTIKIGVVRGEWRVDGSKAIGQLIAQHAGAEGKIRFGVSTYDAGAGTAATARVRKSMEAVAHEVKRALAEETERSVRWVTSREPQLSSVIVAKEKLLPSAGGVEVLVLATKERLMVGHTIAIQSFEAWGERDVGKPSRNMERGMLPPKLARMLINLAVPTTAFTGPVADHPHRARSLRAAGGPQSAPPVNARLAVLDPFCGTGTVLMEALALGYRTLGSDSDPRAIAEARANLAWFLRRHPAAAMPDLRVARAEHLASLLAPASVNAIVTEPSLGPTRGARANATLLRELRALYVNAFRAFARVLVPGGRVVFITPAFRSESRSVSVDIVSDVERFGFRRITMIPEPLRNHPLFAGTQGLSYAREGQRVGRNILTFERA